MKPLLSIVLSLCILLGMTPVTASAHFCGQKPMGYALRFDGSTVQACCKSTQEQNSSPSIEEASCCKIKAETSTVYSYTAQNVFHLKAFHAEYFNPYLLPFVFFAQVPARPRCLEQMSFNIKAPPGDFHPTAVILERICVYRC